ncbi:MAG: threonine--tRNA ligase [Candidatus Nealsonbacteria bacterium RIFOXYB1_FULL_40_15]|uniref:Threonine--tRNA ligase n=1 Tax=Candidatus Nealsonbacteria bacterium RIFOXYB1_FULL_40_15 TaxID=1801677 RepID=A0A1G2ER73_9BACT|nr:MAG: threonine--tRNA ligase [Candidatus Nealsonbacteria bacterium RIFOXYB1_FULL_40_15]OGZ28601.1 MAG: threonine--tRNA ligase [Candidatus Nealsonbacteria bacterium RIFOXYD1_FULL_39_11]
MEKKRHSLAHVLAFAVKNLYPDVKFGMGPAIENGFYYDFGNLKISDSDLPKIEKEMKKIIAKDILFEKSDISNQEAKDLFKDQPYKLDLLKELPETVSVYKSGDFRDLCSGPHIKSVKEIAQNSFRLSRIAGAYWKGDEKNPMLTRIYGLAFENENALNDFLKFQEEAEKRDHRKLGAQLDLFTIDEETGQGLPLWLPKGALIRRLIENYLYNELTAEGYNWLYTPHIGKLNLWKTSGHWNFYKENLYSPIQIDEEQYLLKPMNCPFHLKAYNSKKRSYKELPIKYAEFGTVYRYERSGTLHGLTRVRGFTQDDAHLICASEQMPKELEKLVKHGIKILKNFGFKEFNIYLSTRPEVSAGTDEGWEKATETLKQVLNKLKLKFQVDQGGGVFYGPKIDIKIKDSLGREWQCTTVQFDFNLPEKFKIRYVDKDGQEKEPFMIHRALLGSFERFFGVLIEHFTGAFPVWLSPVQASVIPISKKHLKYAKDIYKKLQENEIRAEIFQENETVGKKIRAAEMQKIPYIFIIGDKEQKKGTVSVRQRKKGDIGNFKLKKAIEKILEDIEKRK